MITPQQALAALGAAAIALALGAGGGWIARGVLEQRDQLQDQLKAEQDARAALAKDVRAGNDASAGYQKQLAQIRAALSTKSKEADHALQSTIACADGASAVPLGGVAVPAVVVDRLRDAGADRAADPAAAR